MQAGKNESANKTDSSVLLDSWADPGSAPLAVCLGKVPILENGPLF